MRYRLPISAVVFLLFLLCAVARSQIVDSSIPPAFRNSLAFDGPNQHVTFLSGRVVSADGFAIGESVTVVLDCGSQVQARTHSDSKGYFNLTLALTGAGPRGDLLGSQTGAVPALSLANCELHGEVPGYSSEYVRLAGGPDAGIVQVGTITLQSVSPDHTFSVSAISLAAPEKAKKSLQKGREQAKKGKWSAAANYFKRAIEAYPRYALAWVELGRMQVQENSFADAQQSFQQSVEQDNRFIDGYSGLAYLALQQHQWKQLADLTERVVEFLPDSAQFWFLNAVANFNLGDIERAETSIGRGLRLDPQHQIPDMEYLYGLILAHRHQYDAAVEHVSTYLRLAPRGSNVPAAQKTLAELAQNAQYPSSASR